VEEQEVVAPPVEGGEASKQPSSSMADLLQEECGRIVPERGETLEGTIVSIGPSEILIDVGCKSEGVVPVRDLERLDPKYCQRGSMSM